MCYYVWFSQIRSHIYRMHPIGSKLKELSDAVKSGNVTTRYCTVNCADIVGVFHEHNRLCFTAFLTQKNFQLLWWKISLNSHIRTLFNWNN